MRVVLPRLSRSDEMHNLPDYIDKLTGILEDSLNILSSIKEPLVCPQCGGSIEGLVCIHCGTNFKERWSE